MGGTAAPDPWWEGLYDELLAEILLVRTGEALRAEAAFLADVLELEPGDRVFDQCCGIGNLGVAMARLGMDVVGVDQCGGYIERARREAEAAGAACEFLRADAFEFAAGPPCDAAYNWRTGFGYAADDAGNTRMLRRAFDSLRPGGRFVLDFQNFARVLRDFRPSMVYRTASEGGALLLIRESELDLPGGSLNQTWTFILADGRRSVRRSRSQHGELSGAAGGSITVS